MKLAAVIMLGALAAQAGAQPDAKVEAADRALSEWLTRDSVSEEARDDVAELVLDAGRPGLQRLGRRLAAVADAQGTEARERRGRLQSLTVAVALGFLDRVIDSEMIFAGQYLFN